MEKQELIPLAVFCQQFGVAISFISSLQESGLIQVTEINEIPYLPIDQLEETEKLVRLHVDLDINPEGVEVVAHLLHRLIEQQAAIQALENRLRFYEMNE